MRSGEFLALLMLLAALAAGGPVHASQADNLFSGERCVSASPAPVPPPDCAAEQAKAGGARGDWLWIAAVPSAGQDAVSVRTSRFERVAVEFRAHDGRIVRQEAASGDYGRHKRIGGTLLFRAPAGHSPLVSVAVGIKGAHWPELLDARLVASSLDEGSEDGNVLIGAGLALLLLSVIANAGVGIGLRRPEPLWNAAWAGFVLAWGVTWTHLLLSVAPGLAGTASARLVTLFSTGAIVCAGGYLLAATPHLRSWARQALRGATLLVLLAGVSTGLVAGAWLPAAAAVLNLAVMAAALIVVIVCALAWQDRQAGVRAFAYSFAVPTAAVLWSIVSGRGLTEDDANGMYLVLLACSLQTLWLGLATARRVWDVRQERDEALASEARMASLAETDPLTGLLNRRGFIGRAEAMIGEGPSFTLILLDLDRFKAVNDASGHQAGDAVLCAVAAALRRMPETARLTVGRLGGEEFGIAVAMERGRAVLLAERLRLRLANLPIAFGSATLSVTASFGVAGAAAGEGWSAVYRAADEALYRAKAGGRNRVELAGESMPQAA